MLADNRRRIAVIGAGVAGLVAAYRLSARHRVTLYEAADYPGGHTRTLAVQHEGRQLAVDIGFIVYNDWTYPNFIALLDELGVATQPSSMGFSVHDTRTGLEYQGGSLNGLFAQRSNLLRPGFYAMLADIRRFFADGKALLDRVDDELTLGGFLQRQNYGQAFREQFLVPMGAAIWSTDPARMLDFPAASFLRFFRNHGLLNVRDRPQWRVLQGGSRTYVDALLRKFSGELRLAAPVTGLERRPQEVLVHAKGAPAQAFDYVVLACHSDQALAMLDRPDAVERDVLGSIAYQPNDVVLHSDARLLPRRRRAWAAWNYRLGGTSGRATLTYNMNILQGLGTATPLCVTLNDTACIDPARILHRETLSHPQYSRATLRAQGRLNLLNGRRRSFYCGAYWGYGFHEDGVVSAIRAAADLEQCINDEQLPVCGTRSASASHAGP